MKIASGKNSWIPNEPKKGNVNNSKNKKYIRDISIKKIMINFIPNIKYEAIKVPKNEFLELVQSMQ